MIRKSRIFCVNILMPWEIPVGIWTNIRSFWIGIPSICGGFIWDYIDQSLIKKMAQVGSTWLMAGILATAPAMKISARMG